MLVTNARNLAASAYSAPKPSAHAAPDYETTVKMTYGKAQAIAGNVRLFPASKVNAPFPVAIHLVQNGKARQITNTKGLFVGTTADDAAGFRVMEPDGKSDWLACMGASYFRASGSRDQYGFSARGIAIDTGSTHGEEFPSFTHFWIEEAGPDQVLVHALLDGPSLTGAFAFDCRKALPALTRTSRPACSCAGTSSNWALRPLPACSGTTSPTARADRDWRPEIHDSDGLAIWAGNGERIWRPLENPATPAPSSPCAPDSPKGFGLLQRDQNFDHYQDDGVFYDRAPVALGGTERRLGTGRGLPVSKCRPTAKRMDNIAMFWHGRPPRQSRRTASDFAYRLTWTSNDPTIDGDRPLRRRVRSALPVFPVAPPIAGARKFVFDFERDPALAGLTATAA